LAEAGRRILIVQEDSIEAGLIGFHLKQAGMTALVVTSTQEAWDAIGWGPPEVIIAELKTENIDGLEVVGGLVGKEVAAFLTSDGIPTPEEELEALDRGVREIFTKPIDHRIMAQRVATATLRVMEEGDASETAPIRGWLQDHSMTSLLDMCRRLKLNARLSVELPNSENGHLVIREGRVIDGVRGDRAGKEAVFTVMTLASSRFTLTPVIAEDPLLEGVDRVRMDLASLLEAAIKPRDRSGLSHTSPRTSRRPRTKTGLTTLDEMIAVQHDDDDPKTMISAPPAHMPVLAPDPNAGPSTTTDALSSHMAVDLRLDRPDADAYAPTYISERPLDVANTMQQKSPRSDILRALSGEDGALLFPDDDLVDSLPAEPVEEEDPNTDHELVIGMAQAGPFSRTADAFSAITNDDLAGLDDLDEDVEVDEPVAESTGAFPENELSISIPSASPYSKTDDAFRALTRDDIEGVQEDRSLRVNPIEDDESDFSVVEPVDVDPLSGGQPQAQRSELAERDYAELRPKSGLLQQSELDELDGAFFDDDDDDEDEDEDDDGETFSNFDGPGQDDYGPVPSVPRVAPPVQQTADVLSASAPTDYEPGPETLGAIQAAMPGYGRSRWRGPVLLIGLSLAFLALGGLVISKLMERGPDTSPAAGLSTTSPTETPTAPEAAVEPVVKKSPEEQTRERYGLGNLAAQDDRIDEAMGHYREALKINPDHPGALAGLSAALIKAKRYEDARPMLEELLRVAPQEGVAHLTLGLIAHKLNDAQARGKALKAFIELVPNSPHRAKLLELLTGGQEVPDDNSIGVE
jgi:CheY-like chemotaxis protein